MTETTISNVRLSGSLPKGEANGLSDLDKDLCTTPDKVRLGIIAFDCSKIIEVTDSHEKFPVVRIRSIEVVTNVDQRATLTELMQGAFQERTGLLGLPYEQGDPTEAERLAAAAEEHLAEHPDGALSK